MTTPDRIQYYFENLIHMAFIGRVDGNSKIEVSQINERIKLFFQNNYNATDNKLYDILEKDSSIEKFISLIIADQDIIHEYLRILDLILKNKEKEIFQTKWKYFEINQTLDSLNETIYALKSNKPDGILTKLNTFGPFKQDGGIYIDVYTVPQTAHGNIIGIQGLMPIVNERRNYYIKNKKEAELNVFHSLLVDMKNNAPSLLNDILLHEKRLSPESKMTVQYARDYINNIINQSKNLLSIYSNHAYSNKKIEPKQIAYLERVILKKEEELGNSLNIAYKIDPEIVEKSTLLSPEVFDYFLDQLIKNAIKEYEKDNIDIEERHILIELQPVKLRKVDTLKVSISSKNTSINSAILIDQAGKKPVFSETSTGLGLYFLNTLLELLKASLPLHTNERYFDLISNDDKGVSFEFYYLIN